MIAKIEGKKYSFLSNYNVKLLYNAVASPFALNGINGDEADSMLYKKCSLYFDNTKRVLDGRDFILDGTITDINTSETPSTEAPNIAGYSEAGIWEDVNIAQADYPRQRKQLNIEDLIDSFSGRYEIGYGIFQSDLQSSLEPFPEIEIGETESLKEFYTRLAVQRGLFLSHLNNGTDSTPIFVGRPLESAQLYDIEQYMQNFSKQVLGRGIHSDITVKLQADGDNSGATETYKNDFVTQFRPRTVIMKNGNISQMAEFARKIIAAEMLNVSFSFSSLYFVRPGSIVTRKGVKIFITETEINGTPEGEQYNYKGVLSSVYE